MTRLLGTNRLPRTHILVPILFIAAMTSSPSAPAQRAKMIDRLPVEIVAKIGWQDKELELRKVISCDQRRRMHPGTEGDRELRMRDVWERSAYRVHHVLPSGEVLVFDLPSFCREFDKRVYSPGQGFRPLTFWFNSADGPSEAEEIVSYRYFAENAKRRFEFLSFVIAPSNRGIEAIDDDQRLTWLLRSSGKPDAYFTGVSAAAIPRTVWQQYPRLAAELETRGTGLVLRALIAQHAQILLSGCEGGANGIGPAERCLTSQFDDRPFIVSAVRLSENSWSLDFADVGVRRYSHHVDAARLDTKGCNPSFPTCNLFKGTYRLAVHKGSYDLAKTRGDLIFDADRQLLINPRFRVASSTYINTNRADQIPGHPLRSL